jgi:hypothetical protein
MKKLIYLILFLSIFLYCVPKQDKVERIIEDGVEVVVNHIEPYKIKGEPSTFALEKKFLIDLEREDLAEVGLTEIQAFDLDSKGNIYFSDAHSKENLIFKFDNKGNYLKSFCPKGQGPGEFTSAPQIMLTEDDELAACSDMKLLLFEPDGSLVKEVKTNIRYSSGGTFLDNGNYLFVSTRYPQGGSENTMHIIMLYDSQFNEIKELDRIELYPMVAQRIKGISHSIVVGLSKGKIFTGSQQREYEIYVYDINGNLIKKIRKDYIKVSPSEEYKEQFLGMFKGSPKLYEAAKKKIYFPSSLPPFHHFLMDEKGRLYVMTYEKGVNAGEHMFDIFNPEGVFVGRKSLKGFSIPMILLQNIKIKNDHFYCIEEKESGFRQVVVYKMKWE